MSDRGRLPLGDILQGMGIGTAVILVCFRNIFFVPAAFLFVPFYVRYRQGQRKKERQALLQTEFKNAAALLYSSAAAGSTLEKAFKDALTSMKHTPDRYPILIPEFHRILLLLQRNIPMDQALAQFAVRCRDEDIRSFVRVLQAAGRRGGQIAPIIEDTLQAVTQRIEISQQIRTMLAGRTSEMKVMAIIPAGILIYMNLTSPEYMAVLYTDSSGCLIMAAALVLYLAALFLAWKILDIHV